MKDCFFCSVSRESMVEDNYLAYLIRDGFPVADGHSLIIPKRHVEDYFGLTPDELLACDQLIRSARERLIEEDESIDGFNIGINSGAAAGQTVFHCHFHLIPRRTGDVENPRGGVRNIIPGKGNY
ncbi:MAG: HIT family protein [Acidobacteriota bacterium]|nr:MAG: HIT family protein [Acidobacteriota bacterium]